VKTSGSEVVVLVTASTAEEADRIGKMAVDSRLVACASIVRGVHSIFHWEEKINVENECLIVMKTTLDRFSELEAAVRRHHSYKVPEILALPVIAGSAPYLDWVRAETHK
jgi:periplasmic divalent cation tolerance protein